jgi:nicotinamide-nucleotide amidase
MLEVVINKLLIKNKKTLAVAESCSGGLLSNLITDIPGSSQYFILGVIAYSNKSKVSILKIPKDIIIKYGAVSIEVARLMAKSVRRLVHTDFGIGISGIAGPAGGSKEKPVGTVFIAIDSHHKKIGKGFYFKGTRLAIKRKAACKALELLTLCLKRN